MNFIELHSGIQKIIEVYIRIGLWHRGDEATVKETSFKIFYSIYYALYPISILVGSIESDNKDESMLLAQTSIMTTIVLVKLFYLMWRQKALYALLCRIGLFSIKDKDDFTVVDNQLKRFMKWITYFSSYSIFMGGCLTVVAPFIGSERKQFLNIGFPLDYQNNEIAYWIAMLFQFSEVFLGVVSLSFSIIIWYLLFNCSLKYKVLESELEKMGVLGTDDAKRNVFNRDLIAGIKSHRYINESMQHLELFLSGLFSIQLATSAGCICASVYNLAFKNSDNMMEYQIYVFYLIYNFFDIFMVMYFGNEIKLTSHGLSYCLFKSNWMEQSQSCKQSITIFGERLKQTHQLVVLKLYPVTLETFTRILNAAYSMFNILKSLA